MSGETSLTVETLVREVHLVLGSLLAVDRPGERKADDVLAATLADKVSLTLPEYVEFLVGNGFIARVTDGPGYVVLGRGRAASKGSHDATLYSALTAHFAHRLATGELPRRPGAPEAAPGTLFDGRYERGAALGQGTLGTVYRARASSSSRRVAIKEIRHVFQFVAYLTRTEILARVRAAVAAQAVIDHPHVIGVWEMGLDLPFPLIVTELARGGSLRTRIERAHQRGDNGMPIDTVVGVLWQTLLGLSELHARGIVHGGMHPENVLFDERGNVRISDAGLAGVTERPRADSQAPVYVGGATPAYAAPERLRDGKASVAGDLYGVGVMLYEMLTGALPGRRSPMPSALNASSSTTLDDVFERLTRDDPAERFPDAASVLAALRPALPEGHARDGVLWLWATDPFPAVEGDDDYGDVTAIDGQSGSPARGVE